MAVDRDKRVHEATCETGLLDFLLGYHRCIFGRLENAFAWRWIGIRVLEGCVAKLRAGTQRCVRCELKLLKDKRIEV